MKEWPSQQLRLWNKANVDLIELQICHFLVVWFWSRYFISSSPFLTFMKGVDNASLVAVLWWTNKIFKKGTYYSILLLFLSLCWVSGKWLKLEITRLRLWTWWPKRKKTYFPDINSKRQSQMYETTVVKYWAISSVRLWFLRAERQMKWIQTHNPSGFLTRSIFWNVV